jgi:hypothetical protein
MTARKVIIIGTSHNYQCLGDRADAKSFEQFKETIRLTCLKHEAKAVAEEMSEAVIKQRRASESVAQTLCREIGLKHQLSDPLPEIRKKLGICGENEIRIKGFKSSWDNDHIEAEVRKSHEIRERYWLEQLQTLNVWPVIFVCGAKHCDFFSTLLQTNGIKVEIAFKDWSPTDLSIVKK